MKKLAALNFIFMFVLGAVSTLHAAAAQPKRGGTITFAISKELALMNPLVNTSSTEGRIRDLMYEPLLAKDLKGAIQPRLAESWEISKDRKVYTFKLRRGVKFHNGAEMTADDVKFAVDYTLNPKNGAYGLEDLSAVERAEVVDKYTFRLHLHGDSLILGHSQRVPG
jgi:ABC-type transport system substrate-binding protein